MNMLAQLWGLLLLLHFAASPLLFADQRSSELDLSSFSLVGLRVLPAEKRSPAPNFRLEDLRTQKELGFSNYRGKVLVLNFWASWSPACRAAMPAIESLHRELQGQGLAWLAINSAEDRSTVEKYIQKYNYTFPVLLDSQNSSVQRYGVSSLPSTVIVNKSGYIVALVAGSVDWRNRAVVQALENLLAEGAE